MKALSEADVDLLLLIRHFEMALLDLYARGEVSGTTHTCLGQEYIPVALAPLLHVNDFIFSNHRGHGHYLARTGDPEGLLAEILGREGAPCQGVGGSQHLHRDRYFSTGIQGESLAVSVGVALHEKRMGRASLVAAYIGDGTWGEGAVYEALNLAQLWRLPLLVVVENNGIAQSTPTERHMAGTVAGRSAAFGIAHHLVRSTDISRIRAELAPRISRVRTRHEPLVVEFVTSRLGPHSKGDDTRTSDELAAVRANDWYTDYAERRGESFLAADARQRQRVAAITEAVLRRPLCTWEEAG
ncbi:pyruvate dehydrogenase E1 component alpha subunit [Streptomyces misionensis]|uniref:Pyruvate dehydrogenase E1 component alpha subunit n=1 Tax=Streptomyces misionensis TaxID=67331 RepID=A0A1H4I9J9_9ACTN|nr:thiamine pyrophosphate-dependent dehydrogenase E1 component subunit alpha [Streptomyces misionensis]SEB30671.1 pyruvate dehydrogenase E1 component alpha subunit [Streptomyces misionensis]